MRYETDIDKEYLNWIVDTFEIQMHENTQDNFNKRSSVTWKGGRPYLYSPREIGEIMVMHFRNCIKYNQPFTITGLCLRLGMSRQGILNIEKSSNKEFVDIIKKGKGMVEFYFEREAHLSPNPSFPIFVLKNMGWRDKQAESVKVCVKMSDIERVEALERINDFSE